MKPKWITPASLVVEHGRPLSSFREYDRLRLELNYGEVLCSHAKGYWEQAAVIDSQEAFDEVYGGYKAGYTRDLHFYGVSEQALKQDSSIS